MNEINNDIINLTSIYKHDVIISNKQFASLWKTYDASSGYHHHNCLAPQSLHTVGQIISMQYKCITPLAYFGEFYVHALYEKNTLWSIIASTKHVPGTFNYYCFQVSWRPYDTVPS